MPLYAVTYQHLNADSRRMAYAGMFPAEFPTDAIRRCETLHGKQPGFHILCVSEMK